MSEYWILVVVLFIQAIFRFSLFQKWQKLNVQLSLFWQIQFFIYPVVFLLGEILELLGVHILGYFAIVGLLFELICAIIKQFVKNRSKKSINVSGNVNSK